MQSAESPRFPLLPVSPAPNVGLVLDLGRQRRKQIKRLKRADGELALKVQAAAERLRRDLGIDPGKEIVPVVLLYRCAEPDYVVVSRRA
jgi:hypothetical protein